MSIVLQLRRAVSVVFCCQYEGRTAVYEFATAEVLAHQAAALLAHAIATTLVILPVCVHRTWLRHPRMLGEPRLSACMLTYSGSSLTPEQSQSH